MMLSSLYCVLTFFLQAIMEVGEVLQFYDSDKRFPAWGFGGRTYNGSVSHCFDLSPGAYEVRRPSLPSICHSYCLIVQNELLS